MEAAQKRKDHDDIYDQVKAAVVENALAKHQWEDKAAEVLRVIQLNTLEDRLIDDKIYECCFCQCFFSSQVSQ